MENRSFSNRIAIDGLPKHIKIHERSNVDDLDYRQLPDILI